MRGEEIWSVTRLGSKLSASHYPDGCPWNADETIGIGITNTLARTGVANHITPAEARKLAYALLAATADLEPPTGDDTIARLQAEDELSGQSIPDEFVRPVVDLAFDAAKEAAARFQERIWAQDDPRLCITALGIGIGTLQLHLQAMHDGMLATGQAYGLPSREITIGASA